MTDYFTPERIENYEKHESINVKYNLDLLALEGITPKKMAGKRVLDVGCGFGMLLSKFPESDCHGTDSSEIAIGRCRERYPLVKFEVSECEHIPFHERFDLITCFGVLGLVDFDKHVSFLHSCERALSDNGVFIATAPNPDRPFFMGKKDYSNKRWLYSWQCLSDKAYPILRIPNSEKLGRNIFLRVGFGDPIVIVSRRTLALSNNSDWLSFLDFPKHLAIQ